MADMPVTYGELTSLIETNLILLVGSSMVGKTISSCTWPKPMGLLDYDGNFSSVPRTKDKSGQLIVQDWQKIHVIPMAKTTPSKLNFRTDLKATIAPAFAKASLEVYEKYNAIINDLDTKGGLVINNEVVKIKTLVIDSLTTMFTIWQEVVMEMNHVPIPRIADYLTMENQMKSAFIPSLKMLLQAKVIDFVVMTAHTQVDKDETTGMVDEFPIGPSKNMGRNIGKYVDDVLFQKIEGGKRIWKTVPVGFFKYAGSRHNIPDGTEALYKNVEQYFK